MSSNPIGICLEVSMVGGCCNWQSKINSSCSEFSADEAIKEISILSQKGAMPQLPNI
jgi:hypothetical protein